MSVQSVNPFSNFKTNFNTNTATVPQQVQNTSDKTGTSNKKTAAIIGGLAALAFAGTVAAVAIKRHKVPNEVQSTLNDFRATNEAVNTFIESAQKQADEVMEYAQKLFDEVTGLFKKGEEIAPDGTVLRKITGDDTSKIMEEFSQDGTLLRRSEFIDDILDNVEEGIEEFADGSEKIAKELTFPYGKINCYKEGHEKFADGSRKIAKRIDFEDEMPFGYVEGYEELAGGSRKIAKRIGFEDEMPNWYQEGYEELADGSEKIAKGIVFEDEMPFGYVEGYEKLADGSEKIAKGIGFVDEMPFGCVEGYEKLADGSRKIAKEYELTKKPWQEVNDDWIIELEE